MMKKHRIVSAMNGMALTVSRGQHSTRLGDLLVQHYKGIHEQQFYIEPLSSQQYKIRSVSHHDKVIDVVNESQEVYKEIIVYDFHGKPNQKWLIIPVDKDTVIIRSAHSKLVLQIQGGIDHEGMAVVQNMDYKNRNQRWRIQPI